MFNIFVQLSLHLTNEYLFNMSQFKTKHNSMINKVHIKMKF